MDQKKDRKKIKAEPGAAGHKYTWAWILGLFIIVVALFGLSLYQRYKDIGRTTVTHMLMPAWSKSVHTKNTGGISGAGGRPQLT